VSKSDDELGTLTGEMNRTAERLAAAQQRTREHDIAMESAQAQLRRSERLATIGQLAAGVAHELATPLHAISLRAELLQHRSGDAELVKQSAEALRFQAARAGEIIQ